MNLKGFLVPMLAIASLPALAQSKNTIATPQVKDTALLGDKLVAISVRHVGIPLGQGLMVTPDQLIQGKVAGVNVVSNGGAPGAGSRIIIRNGSSLLGSNQPLIIVDGIPLDDRAISGAANPLDFINPNDIESITILKDAVGTAIYGLRGSNGVILITSKKSKASKELHWSYNTVLSTQSIAKYAPVMDTAQFKTAIRTYNSGYTSFLGNSNTDWQKQIYQNAFGTDNTLSFNGGIKNIPYRVSLGYTGDDGIVKTSYMNRQSLQLNASPVFFNKSLKVELNIRGAATQNRFANSNAIGAAVSFDPTQSVYSGNNMYNGYWEHLNTAGTPNVLSPLNPFGLLEETQDVSTVKRVIGNIQLEYSVPTVKGLKISLRNGYDITRSNGTYYQDSTGASGYYTGGDIRTSTQKIINKLLSFQLSYSKELEKLNSHFDVIGGYSYQNIMRQGQVDTGFNLAHTAIVSYAQSDSTELTFISYYGKLNYNYANKYFLTGIVCENGSSRYSAANKWGLFSSVGAAWDIKNESFLKHTGTFSALKLRFSYGVTGNQDFGSYYFVNNGSFNPYTLPNGNLYFQNFTPSSPNSNIGLKPEKQTTYNVGVDYGFLNNRLYGSIDAYDKKSTDLLIPFYAPFSLYPVLINGGSMENKGIEFSITAISVLKKNFSWNLFYNFTYSTSKITSLAGANNLEHGNINGGTGVTAQVYQAGYNPDKFYLFNQVYGTDGKPLEGLYANNNGIPALNYSKSATPKILMGFGSEFTYFKWNAGFLLRAELGNYVYNNNAAVASFTGMVNGTGFLINASATLLKDNFINQQLLSDYFLENASFLKMDNIHIGYDFGKVIDKKVSVHASLTVQNAFTITKYTGVDPEVYGGIDNNAYPRPCIISLGVGLGF